MKEQLELFKIKLNNYQTDRLFRQILLDRMVFGIVKSWSMHTKKNVYDKRAFIVWNMKLCRNTVSLQNFAKEPSIDLL
jgi:hypothetical protein